MLTIVLRPHMRSVKHYAFDSQEDLENWVCAEGERLYGNSNWFFYSPLPGDFNDPSGEFTDENPPDSEFDFWWQALRHDMASATII